METALYSIICIVLAGIAYQDFKHRAIHWLWLPLLLFGLTSFALLSTPLQEVFSNALRNLLFVGIQWLGLTLWFSMRNGRFVNIIDEYIGLGDVLFFVAIAVGFSQFNFVLFFIGALLFSLIAFGAMRMINRKGKPEIPLAGLMAIPLIIVLTLSHFEYINNLHHNLNFVSLITP